MKPKTTYKRVNLKAGDRLLTPSGEASYLKTIEEGDKNQYPRIVYVNNKGKVCDSFWADCKALPLKAKRK